jgi:nitrate reductase / nitrite oxidoreductase, beta subunit
MARVFNWQLGREMSYWYPEARPKRQFAAVFDTNKCIACQTCTLACKTTWTSGKGQEYMLWNNVETKPYGSYPLGLRPQSPRNAQQPAVGRRKYTGQTVFESAPAGERVLGWRPEQQDYAYPNVGEDDCANQVDTGALMKLPHMSWFFYLARICNHCSYPACLSSCPRGSIYKRQEDGIVLVDQNRCRGYQECVKGCPYKKVFFNPMTGTSEKCIACYPKIEEGHPAAVLRQLHRQDPPRRLHLPPRTGPRRQPDRLPRPHPKVALPLFPQYGLEPNIYYIPPIHVPDNFNRQLFGPRATEAVKTYRNAFNDRDLAGLLCLFGSTERMVTRFTRQGDIVTGIEDSGAAAVRIPMNEPVHIRPAQDPRNQLVRINCP